MNEDHPLYKYRFVKGDERTKECATLGGRAAQAQIAKRKTLKEAFNAILELKNKDGVSGVEQIAISAFKKALEGDPQVIKLFAQIVGEFSEKIEVTPSVNLPPLTKDDVEELKELVAQSPKK